MIKILNVGFQACLTDTGRKFAQCQGYSQSGAVDWFSYKLANALCKNSLNAPAIEVMAGTFSMQVAHSCVIAVTGADCELFINNQSADTHKALLLNEGDVVEIGALKQGLFNYVAIHNADFEEALSVFKFSVCATLRERAGGLKGDGTALKSKDDIYFKLSTNKDCQKIDTFTLGEQHTKLMTSLINRTSGSLLPIIFSYQADRFEILQRSKFLQSTYKTTSDMNKMGVRLDGPSVSYISSNLTSQPIAYGAIQIPQNGKPIIMRNERQTIGGYPIIGVVSRTGLARLSQLTPNDKICFEEVSQENALCEFRIIEEQLKQIANR